VVTFAIPLFALARAFAALSGEARRGGTGSAGVVRAMVRNPWVVGGTGRLCTELMRASAGRIFAKVGAEGVYTAGVPGAEVGLALKVHDGAGRAAEPALLAVLQSLGLLTGEEMAALAGWATPRVTNTRDEVVGSLSCRIELSSTGG
jgi:L-asparaginase II